ncbi:hypothetical protein PENTCL1PPCAC_8940, partial [Pristionchus entomophagus]
TQTKGTGCSANNFYMNMGAAPCSGHSMLVSGSGGSRCIGWDSGSTTTPFDSALKTGSNWFVWDGSSSSYFTAPTAALLSYEGYMVLPRVLVTPV